MNERFQFPLVAMLVTALALTPFLSPPQARADGVTGGNEALRWSSRVEPEPGKKDEVTVVLTATIAPGYIVYGSDFQAELGPRPTRVRFDDADKLVVAGPLRSVNARRRKDKTFNTEYTYFDSQVELRQTLRVPADTGRISGRINGQTCFETDGTCTLFRQNFDIALR